MVPCIIGVNVKTAIATETSAMPVRQAGPRTSGPATDRIDRKPDLRKLRRLMNEAMERTTIVRHVHEGWNGSKSVPQSVPTENANKSHGEALRLAQDILAHCDDPEVLSDLRMELNADPMRDTRPRDLRDRPPPLVEEVNLKLAGLMRG